MSGHGNEFAASVTRLRVQPESWHLERERNARRVEVVGIWKTAPTRLLRMPTHDKLAAAADSWQPGCSLVFGGGTRAGKSTAMVRLFARLCKLAVDNGGDDLTRIRGSVWTRADDVTDAARQQQDDYSAQKLLRRAGGCQLLFLDDWGAPSKTLHRVLEARYDRGLETIATTGTLNPPALAQSLGGEAVLRWLLESGKRKGRLVFV